ncbi:hypothetical protein M011DRAFT_381004, partial [Sporormia fimetaria CBS 119925]
PTLTVSPLQPSEAHLYQEIRHETFRPTINKILYTREPSPETQSAIIAKTASDIRDGVLYMVCRDTSLPSTSTTTSNIIAGARWRYIGSHPPRPRTEAEISADLTVPEPYPESHAETYRAFFSLFNDNRREIMGDRPYMVLETLVTHPDHHRRGAGSKLVKWGVEEADRLGVEGYVEASEMGAPLYERYGFREVKRVEMDLRRTGGGEE